MKRIGLIALALLVAAPMAGCGTKGRLRTPDQAAADEAKKARKAEKEAHKKAKEEQKQPEAAPSATPASEQQ